MANQKDTKKRFIIVLRTLFNHTDDKHGVTTQDLIAELAYNGYDADRKSINGYLTELKELGYEIEHYGGKYWRLVNRPFDRAELRLLVNAVQSSPLLSEQKAAELIEKLKFFAVEEERDNLCSRITVSERGSVNNDQILESVERIQEAIRTHKKIEFNVVACGYDYAEGRYSRIAKNCRTETPVDIVYARGQYFCVTYRPRVRVKRGVAKQEIASAAENVRDKYIPFKVHPVRNMTALIISDQSADRSAEIANYSFKNYAVTNEFLPSEVQTITLRINPHSYHVLEHIGLRYGNDYDLTQIDEYNARVRVKDVPSFEFYAWLTGLPGHAVVIAGPSKIKEEYLGFLRKRLSFHELCSNKNWEGMELPKELQEIDAANHAKQRAKAQAHEEKFRNS